MQPAFDSQASQSPHRHAGSQASHILHHRQTACSQSTFACSVRIEAMATVKVNKRITETIRELNGSLSKEIRLGAVARKLSELEVEKALELLNEVPETHADPTKYLLQALVCRVGLQMCRRFRSTKNHRRRMS